MSVGAQIDKFYLDVSEKAEIWHGEMPNGDRFEFDVKDGRVSFPVWSSKSRIQRLKKLSPEVLGEVEPKCISLSVFMNDLVPILVNKNRLINLNLSGKNLIGFDLELSRVVSNLEPIENLS